MFSSLLRFGSFNSSKQISLVTIFFIGFIANKETLVFFHYWICCKQRSHSELTWCARNKRPRELQKKGLRRKMVLFQSVAARDHFERVSCKLYKNIWAIKSQLRRQIQLR